MFKPPPTPAELLRSHPVYQQTSEIQTPDVTVSPWQAASVKVPSVQTSVLLSPSTSNQSFQSLPAIPNSRNETTSYAANTEPASLPLLNSASFAALHKNPISALMEYAQARKTTATLEIISETGPPHRPVYVTC